MPCGAGRSRRLLNADAQLVTMTAGYRDFRLRDEDPNDHAAVAAMQARSEAVKADEQVHHIRLAIGDRVKVEISPYDPERGRIVQRLAKHL